MAEDQVRDKAKAILGLENTETARAGVGQPTLLRANGCGVIVRIPTFHAAIPREAQRGSPLFSRDSEKTVKILYICGLFERVRQNGYGLQFPRDREALAGAVGGRGGVQG